MMMGLNRMPRALRLPFVIAIALLIGAALLAGCPDTSPPPVDDSCYPPYAHTEAATQTIPSNVLNAAGDQYDMVVSNDSGEQRTYEIGIDGGNSTIWRLYFVFSNPTATAACVPKLSVVSVPPGTETGPAIATQEPPHFNRMAAPVQPADPVAPPPIQHIHLPHPEIPLIPAPSSRPFGLLNRHHGPVSGGTCSGSAPSDALGDTITLDIDIPNINDTRTSIDITARVIRDVDLGSGVSQRIVFWSTDNVYEGCTTDCLSSDSLLTAGDINAIADSFVQAGDNNDIYDWTRELFGAHWGVHDACATLIPPSHTQIDVVFYNIGGTTGITPYRGGILGYYRPVHNFLRSVSDISSERLILHMHAPYLKLGDSVLNMFGVPASNWETERDSAYYTVLSTLVHEYQHLIHFYQRYVRLYTSTDISDVTWINEMFSLSGEDMLSHNIHMLTRDARPLSGANDVRGTNTLAAGSYGLCNGNLPRYTNTQSGRGISQWQGELWNYGAALSFGSYLIRNYGGVNIIADAYQSDVTNEAALSAALSAHGLTMGDVIARWGVAMLLSDVIVNSNGMDFPPVGYRLNYGTSGLTHSYNGAPYTFGSINYYNYVDPAQCGAAGSGAFRVFRDAATAFDHLGQHDGHANIIIAAAQNMTGAGRFKVTIDSGQQITAVAKRVPTQHNPVFY